MFRKERLIALNNGAILRKELLPFLKMLGGKCIHLKHVPNTTTRLVTVKLKTDDWAYIMDFFNKRYPNEAMMFMTLGR